MKKNDFKMKNLLYSVVFTLIVSIIFIVYPEVDIEFSKLFFSENNQKFYFANHFFLKFVSNLAYFLAFLLLVYNSILILKTFVKTKSFNFEIYKPQMIVLLVFFIGSVMIVQVYSKHYFGRARPIHVKEFNGHSTFTPAFKVSNQCKFNCSFVSFHTSIGLLFLIHSFGLIGKKRKTMIVASCLLITLLGLTRIVQGKHFLSDVVVSACFMIITYYLIMTFCEIYRDKKSKSSTI